MPTSRRKPPEPMVLPGVVFTLRRKCGKPGCHCATGDPHETPALAYPDAGRTKTLTLANADLDEVRGAVAPRGVIRSPTGRARILSSAISG